MPRCFSVLLVEDDDPLRRCLTEVLAVQGWAVYPTGSGHEAVKLARQHRVDFSLLDLHLPGISGLEVLRIISKEVRPLPSIIMSGQATPEERRQALTQGVFQFLHKPIELEILRRSMDLLIRHHFGAPPGGSAP